MICLAGDKEQEAMQWIGEAGKVAHEALCLKAKCGSVIVQNGEIIGRGYNAPPRDDPANRKCLDPYDGSGKPRYDHTCCMHAEWRAILDAMKRSSNKITGSTIYFARLDEHGDIRRECEPLCTVCSRFALDAGISHFVLWREQGACSYPTDEYNNLSYSYRYSDKG